MGHKSAVVEGTPSYTWMNDYTSKCLTTMRQIGDKLWIMGLILMKMYLFCNAPHHVRSAPSRKLRQKTNEIKAKMTADMKLWFTWECYWGWRYTATCLSTLVAWSFYNVSDVINESGWELLKACGIINIYSNTPAVIQIQYISHIVHYNTQMQKREYKHTLNARDCSITIKLL